MNPAAAPSTIGTLLSELRDESTTLLRQEVALAKAELGEKAAQAGKSATEAATGGAAAHAGLVILLMGVGHLARHGLIAAGLDEDVAQWLGFLLVGGIVAFIGWRLLARARKALTADALKPAETLASLRESQQWAKSKIKHAHEPAH